MSPQPTDQMVLAARNGVETLYPLPWDAPLLLAVSGGADSMALLHLLHRAGVPVAVAHFDHQTRGGASATEGDFVAETARALNVAVHRESADVTAIVAAGSESFEMAARRVRYDFLAKTARAESYGAIATGHHADDQAETLLLRLLRGASPTGMAGIPPRRMEQGVLLIRPLLGLRRAALEGWLRGEGLAWREDTSNRDTDVLRNRVRHELLPRLGRDFTPGAVEALCRLARIQRREETFLARLAEDAFAQCSDEAGRIERACFRDLDEALQYRVLTVAIQEAGGEACLETVQRAVDFVTYGAAGKQIDVGRGISLHAASDHVVFSSHKALESPALFAALPVPGEVIVADVRIQTQLEEHPPGNDPKTLCSPTRQLFDADCLDSPLAVRTRRPGDRFQPFGMTGRRKIKDYFNDLGLTQPERDRQLLLTCGSEIIWVVGHACSGRSAITPNTTRRVSVTVSPHSETDANTTKATA